MSARFRDSRRSLLLGAALATLATAAGCAVSQPSDHRARLARTDADCPMSFTLVCEARRPGGEPVRCRCVRNKLILSDF